jgi:hypothetical protein
LPKLLEWLTRLPGLKQRDCWPMKEMQQPPFSPDVATSEFYPFGMLHEKLKNHTAKTFDELKQEVDSILKNITEAQLGSVFQTWPR